MYAHEKFVLSRKDFFLALFCLRTSKSSSVGKLIKAYFTHNSLSYLQVFIIDFKEITRKWYLIAYIMMLLGIKGLGDRRKALGA